MTTASRLYTFAEPYRWALAASCVLMLLESAAALAVPGLGGRLAGVLLQDGTQAGTVTVVLGALLALFTVQALLKFGNSYLLGGTSAKLVADLKVRMYDHLQALPIAFFHQRRQGDTLALLTNDVYVVSGFVSGPALAVVPLLVTAGGAALVMFRIKPSLALLAVIIVPMFYLLLKILGRGIRPLAQRLQEEHATSIAIAEENLGMMPAIKTFTREPQESLRHRRQIDLILHLTARQLRILGRPPVQMRLKQTEAAFIDPAWRFELCLRQIGSGDPGNRAPAWVQPLGPGAFLKEHLNARCGRSSDLR